MDEGTLRDTVAAMMPQVRSDLEGLVRIPSVSFSGFPSQPLRQAAEATRELLTSVGAADARFLELEDGRPPAVVGSIAGPADAPTVLLYAHYDVQPVGDEDAWITPPFEPVERDGRLYGRGSADDKGGLAMHAAALRVFGDAPPVNVKCIVEGEEETGESGLDAVVASRPALFEADAVVVADMGNAEIGIPTLTTSLRGVTSVVVEARTLRGEVHSGLFGGPAPDALMALVRVLASLHDEHGNCAVAGLAGADWEGADQTESEFRRLAGVEDDVALTGSGSVGSRLWSRPSINVIGIDAPRVHASRNVLVDVARARVSLRVSPEQDPAEAQRLLIAHLEAAAPWNVRLHVTPMETGPGISVSTEGPAHEAMRDAMAAAFERDATQMGSGGSIPLIHALAETFPVAEILMFGAEEPRTNIHAPNESVDLRELERLIVTEALFLERFGRRTLEA